MLPAHDRGSVVAGVGIRVTGGIMRDHGSWRVLERSVLVLGMLALAGPVRALARPQAPAAQTRASSCDRACLDGLMDRYLAALAAKDPARLPLAGHVKFTENGQRLELGDGLWGTIDRLGRFKLEFADPVSGEVGYFGTIEESGRHQILGVRLKIRHRKITEIETWVVRPQPGVVFGDPQALKVDPLFVTALKPSERRTRAQLIRIANSYFEGLRRATGAVTPFAADCQRIENGIVTANNPNPHPQMKMWHLGCHAQFASRFSQFITGIRDRRFPIVDVRRGLVLALVFFDQNGRMKKQTLADGTVSPVPPDMQVPYTFQIEELFKIENGKIRRILALVNPVPYHMRSGWGDTGLDP